MPKGKKKSAAETDTKSLKDKESAKALGFVLRRLEKIAGCGGFQNVVISPTKSKTLISAALTGTIVETTLPEKLKGLETAWNFDFAKLAMATVGRQSEDLSVEEDSLIIKDRNRYRAQLIGSEASNIPRVERVENAECQFEATGDVQVVMREALQAVNIVKSLPALPDITVHVSFTKKRVHVVTWDKSQMVSYLAKNETDQIFEFTLPLPRAQSLFKEGLGDATISINDGSLYVHDGAYRMSASLPPPEAAAGIPLERVKERAVAVRDLKLPRKVFFHRDALAGFLENAKALSRISALVKFEILVDSANLTISADGSNITATIPAQSKKEFTFFLDIAYVQAIMDKTKSDIEIHLDDNAFMMTADKIVYMAMLSSAPEKASKKVKETEADEV